MRKSIIAQLRLPSNLLRYIAEFKFMKLVFVEEKSHLGGKYFYYEKLISGVSNSGLDIHILTKKKNFYTTLEKLYFKILSKVGLCDYSLKCLDVDCKKFCRDIAVLSEKIIPDIIHVQHPLDAYYISHSKWRNVPVVQTVHSFWLYETIDKKLSNAHLEKINYIQNFSYSYISRFISLNELQYKQLIESGVAKEKITIIPNAIDKFKVNNAAALAPFTFEGQYLSIVCRLSPEKGVDVALRALALIAEGSRPMLIIVGDGPEKQNLKKLAIQLGLSRFVRFLGGLAHDKALGVMKGSILSLCPSINYNGIQDAGPLSVLESIALGVPVAASRVGGLPEYIQHGKNGYLFSEGDAQSLSEIISGHLLRVDSATVAEMKVFMEESSRKNSYDVWIEKKICLYKEMSNIL